MLIRCPACGSQASLDTLIDNEPAAKALLLALKLSPVGASLVKYLGLFRPAKSSLSMARVATILGEITPLIAEQKIERNGIAYPTTMAIWESSIAKVLEARDFGRLTTPLKSHGYLLEIIVSELARFEQDKQGQAVAKKQAEKNAAEKVLEDARKRQDKQAEAPKPRSEFHGMPATVKAAFAAALNGAKKDAALLTPEQLEAKKHDDIARLKSMLTPEQRQQCEQRNPEHANA